MVYAVSHELWLWRGGGVLCGEVAFFKLENKKFNLQKSGGQGVGLSPGTVSSSKKHKKEGWKKATWSHQLNCCRSRYVPRTRCGRDDPLRRAMVRLVYS